MGSTPKKQGFFCIFQKNLALATLGLKEMGRFLWECREKSLPSWLSQFSFASHSKVHWENAKKVWYYEKLVGRHASFSPRRSVKCVATVYNVSQPNCI
jgi:hypothetical protein